MHKFIKIIRKPIISKISNLPPSILSVGKKNDLGTLSNAKMDEEPKKTNPYYIEPPQAAAQRRFKAAAKQMRERSFAPPPAIEAAFDEEAFDEEAFDEEASPPPAIEAAFDEEASPPPIEGAFAAAASPPIEGAEMLCDLDATPDISITNMLKKFSDKFRGLELLTDYGKYLKEYITGAVSSLISSRENVKVSNGVVLINSCHGGLLVTVNLKERKYAYDFFFALSYIERLIKSVPTCCSYIYPDVRLKYLETVITIAEHYKGLVREGKFPDIINDHIIHVIRYYLWQLSFDIPIKKTGPAPESIPEFPINSTHKHTEQTKEMLRTASGSGQIWRNSEYAFAHVKNERRQRIINKLFSTDEYIKGDETRQHHNLAPRGMLFCNDVTITVDIDWVFDDNPYNYIIENNDRGYEIGLYHKISETKATISYTTRTNLLSCPYFMFFASKSLGSEIITLNNSLSLGWDNKRLILMVTQLSAQVLYWYLSYQPFLFIDMSCESLCFRDEAGHALNTAEQMSYLKSDNPQYENIKNRLLYLSFRGGNRKTRCNPKKYNTKKYKRYNSKKYKTKKYKKRNMSQKQG